MAPSPSQDRPWVTVDSDEARLRLLEEAYRNDPGALSSEDLYELCDLADPFWDVLRSSQGDEQSKDHVTDVPLAGSQPRHADEPSDIPKDTNDEICDAHDKGNQTISGKSDKTIDSEATKATEAHNPEAKIQQFQPAEDDVSETSHDQISEATEEVPSETQILSPESSREVANKDTETLKRQEHVSSTKRERDEGAISGEDERGGRHAKVQRIEAADDMVVIQAPQDRVDATASLSEHEIDEPKDDTQASSDNRLVLYTAEGHKSSLYSWMEASHDYIPALLFSALILHLHTRNL